MFGYLNHLVYFGPVSEVGRQTGGHVTVAGLEALQQRRVIAETRQVLRQLAAAATTARELPRSTGNNDTVT